MTIESPLIDLMIPTPQDLWNTHLDVVRTLLESWWEVPQERVAPPALVKGQDLLDEFALKPGPRVGQLLEFIREGQATGLIQNRKEALAAARQWLEEKC